MENLYIRASLISQNAYTARLGNIGASKAGGYQHCCARASIASPHVMAVGDKSKQMETGAKTCCSNVMKTKAESYTVCVTKCLRRCAQQELSFLQQELEVRF